MRLLSLVFVFASAAAAQVGDGLVTLVTRNVSIAPDQAEFLVVATTGLDASQSDVLQVFRKAGIQNVAIVAVAAGPNTIQYPVPAASQVYYGISFTTAPDALKEFVKRLDSMKAEPPEPITTLQSSAVLSASPAAVEAAHQSVLPSLLNEARSKAQALAQAAGLKLGAIQGLSESSYAGQGISTGYFLTGAISPPFGSAPGAMQYTFYASVKFGVQ